MGLCQQLDSEIQALQLHEGRHGTTSHQYCGSQNQLRTTTAAPPYPTSQSATAPGPMDLSASKKKLSEQEHAARLREGHCLYCGGVGHMAAQCPNKNRNPLRAAATLASDPEPQATPEYHQCTHDCGSTSAPLGKA